jgi:membrane protease YdiL (CAAX protease family)
MSTANLINKGRKQHLIAITSWCMLLASQIYFNVNPPPTIWPQVAILSTIMIASSALWVKTEPKSTLRSWLGLDARRITILTYTCLAAVIVFFTRNSFKEATLLAGGSLILPIVEELYFRCYLLGSAINGWPSFFSLERSDRLSFVVRAAKPLLLSSVAFALVHSDVVNLLLRGTAVSPMLPVIILFRVLFGFAVGEIYILQRNLAAPAAFHIAFNLSFYLFSP